MDRLRREGGRYSASTPSSRAKPVAQGEDEYGRVVTLKQSFGFIRCGSRIEPNGRETQVFFHASEFHPEIPNRDKPSLDPGDLVKFTTAPSAKGDGQTNGFNVRKCEESEVAVTVLAKDILGVISRTLRGKMKRDAYGGRLTYDATKVTPAVKEDDDNNHDASQNIQADGAMSKESETGDATNADDETDVASMTDPIEFVGDDLHDECRLSKLKNGVVVKFTLLYDPYKRTTRAVDIREAFPQPDKKKSDDQQNVTGADSDNWNREKVAIEEEFGVISIVKTSYGFIKCCSRSKDLFFHFSELSEDPDTLRVGQEVSFRISEEPRSGKTVAAGIRFAPKGSAVFETVDERICRGVCKAKLLFVKGFPGKDDGRGPPPKGMIEESPGKEYAFNRAALVDPRRNPHVGDLVQFCVRTDKRTLVESACKVEIMRFVGKVTSTKSDGLYGFVEHVDPGTGESGKAFVHGAEVEGNSTLNVGDELEYSLQVGRKENEFTAKRVKVTTAAPIDPNAPPKEKSSDSPRSARDNQFSGSQFVITKGPDGTRGFSLGRGAGLAEKAAAIVSQLCIDAAAFVPPSLGASTAGSSSLSLADDVEINPDAVEDA